ncbi:docking protein 2-like [Solea senegalensis]|uniref:Docking protein 2-like n=1 Tax=Solea senegalensis TaxID=28829 RepID=A0AAV6QH86_SOLSE|nr:docking protein 2 [Solea senegalensis]KAG7490871.1 docking protein 2-like [Solea senegalensis]
MEEDIRKQGILYLQQQRFGKKWKRVWSVLYRDSSCSISRLEFFECKDGGTVDKSDRSLRKQQEHKKVIRLSDCIRVSEVEIDGCPRDTAPFLVETTDKIYVFAADRGQVDDWTHKLCEIAFPMSWTEPGGKRGSLQRGNRVDEDGGMEDNLLYSSRDTVREFRVCVRRTEASDRCRLKGDGLLRADRDALHLLHKTGDVMFTWPYRYLRRFGRDKSTFSFEAGRRCESGEGSFEFETKQGNTLFQVVEAAINLQKISFPNRQTSSGDRASPEMPQNLNTLPAQSRTLPLSQPRSHIPQTPAPQAVDGVYSTVCEHSNPQMSHHKENSTTSQQQLRPQLSHLEPPVEKVLTGVKSLTLDTRGLPVPRKNQVKMISSCPLPHAEPGPNLAPGSVSSHNHLSPKLSSNLNTEQMYSQITQLATREQGIKRERREGGGIMAPPCTPPLINPDPDYSLPFDIITKNVMADILSSHQAPIIISESVTDPLYDSIDEMKIRNNFLSQSDKPELTYSKGDHIYDEPEGCGAAPGGQRSTTPSSVYDDPEEMRGDAWRLMGTVADPKGHEYPYNPRVDDYAVPKRPQRAFPVTQSTTEEDNIEEEKQEREEEEQEQERGEQEQDSPYNNVMVKKV